MRSRAHLAAICARRLLPCLWIATLPGLLAALAACSAEDRAFGAGGAGPGGGGPVPCTEASQATDCDDSSPCTADACVGGWCANVALEDGPAPAPAQVQGDCRIHVCVGGAIASAADDADLPDDASDCTTDACDAGAPLHDPVAAGAPCGAGGDLMCDGAGVCVGCTASDDCGLSSECLVHACEAGMCVAEPAPPGTPLVVQESGDCLSQICDGAGGVTAAPDDTDLPDDGLACTGDQCQNGVPVFVNLAQGTPCGQEQQCNGTGQCLKLNGLACADASECLSGFCVDGVCCNNACNGMCRACTAAKKGGGSDGECGGIECIDPDNECLGQTFCLLSGSCGFSCP